MRSKKMTNLTGIAMSGLLILSPVTLQANWLEKGAELFKEIQTSEGKSSSQDIIKTSNLSSADIEKAFKQALDQGTQAVVSKLGVKDGFNADPKVRIPLPKSLTKVKSTLATFGMGGYMDDVETKLNRAAEKATPQAKALFINAIKEMSFEDVQKIYNGPQDSATQYLKQKTSPQIKEKMAPIVENTLNEVGALKAYDKAIDKYKKMPFVPDVKADLLDHVVNEGIEGMFYYIAQEEAAIRKDPVKQSTELLKKVFGK